MDASADARAWLSTVLAPVPVDEFLSTYWLKQHLFCRGESDRFSPLLSWTELNRILEHHWRETYRFRLALQGRDLDPATYADLDGFTPRIRSKDVTDHLRRGATLSFDAIDEVHAPLTQLSEQFERLFRGGTKINIYAGWRALHGLDLHRDNQEIFILQLDGRKRWLVYGFSIDGIDRGQLATTSVPPAGAVLDRVLQPGDLLYIPRGCYHLAVPMNEPTLHLTLGVKNPRAADLQRWMIDRERDTEVAQRDLPVFATADERLRYADEIRRMTFGNLDADLVEQYFLETGSNFKPRPSFSLPYSATPELLPPGDDFVVRLNDRVRAVADGSEAGPYRVRFGGRLLQFPRGMQWIVERLEGGSPVPMRHLMGALDGRLDHETVRTLLAMLQQQGLIAVFT
jgi:ribosomal protein L16 Arg81 hydroxylase